MVGQHYLKTNSMPESTPSLVQVVSCRLYRLSVSYMDALVSRLFRCFLITRPFSPADPVMIPTPLDARSAVHAVGTAAACAFDRNHASLRGLVWYVIGSWRQIYRVSRADAAWHKQETPPVYLLTCWRQRGAVVLSVCTPVYPARSPRTWHAHAAALGWHGRMFAKGISGGFAVGWSFMLAHNGTKDTSTRKYWDEVFPSVKKLATVQIFADMFSSRTSIVEKYIVCHKRADITPSFEDMFVVANTLIRYLRTTLIFPNSF